MRNTLWCLLILAADAAAFFFFSRTAYLRHTVTRAKNVFPSFFPNWKNIDWRNCFLKINKKHKISNPLKDIQNSNPGRYHEGELPTKILQFQFQMKKKKVLDSILHSPAKTQAWACLTFKQNTFQLPLPLATTNPTQVLEKAQTE